ncbi:hypothetical protein KAM372_21180 [Aeromonas caviae]|nr:hypothetical protein KAM376_43800 [Aeromonas caviae]GJA98237.1 hypothetical protein KAM359_16450 [Aeromonas caviae]GJB45785.1 hypothetical protein KAM370_17270 [Aeromonas caviae]GJB50657.1 hypothetical protein KAM372_21180 [Aeromonas caviae]GJB54673.1 hypothetical protein KAM373_16680 [Aeromonas caviae]
MPHGTPRAGLTRVSYGMRLPGNLQEERLREMEMTGYRYHGVPWGELGVASLPTPGYSVLPRAAA